MNLWLRTNRNKDRLENKSRFKLYIINRYNKMHNNKTNILLRKISLWLLCIILSACATGKERNAANVTRSTSVTAASQAMEANQTANLQPAADTARPVRERNRRNRKRIPPLEIYDPWEPFNRKIYAFNNVMDRYVAKPLAKGYTTIIPKPVRKMLHNAIGNLRSPLDLIHAILQLDPKGAANITSRFVLNSTVGLLGAFDVAAKMDLKDQGSRSMGQTLAKYGLRKSPYLVIPFLGPSTLTDAIGQGVDIAINPVYTNGLEIGSHEPWIEEEAVSWWIAGVNLLDMRANMLENLDDILANSFDPYTMSRNAYLQYRHRKIYGSKRRSTSKQKRQNNDHDKSTEMVR